MTETEIQDVEARLRPGARRRKTTLRQTPVMLGEAERQVLDAVADKVGRSRSALIREAVYIWLKKKGEKARL